MATTTVDYAGQVLADVRRGIAVDDEVLSETKARRNLVKRHARSYPGAALKTFDSGSVAHGTVEQAPSPTPTAASSWTAAPTPSSVPTATALAPTTSSRRWPRTCSRACARTTRTRRAGCASARSWSSSTLRSTRRRTRASTSIIVRAARAPTARGRWIPEHGGPTTGTRRTRRSTHDC